jgi:Fe2+ transport system protein FeoA
MTRLSILPAGARGRVVLLGSGLRDQVDRLASLGLAPGSEVYLVQRRPAFVLELGETRLALDVDVARGIFIQRLS